MKTKLLDFIDKIFNFEGSIAQLGGRYSEQQHEYARHIALSLIEENKVSFLEAETGIGKSLGYLIPVLLVLHLSKQEGISFKPIAISTNTRQLQKQIFQKDANFARKVLRKIGIETNDLVIAYRMGRSSFFSIERTKIACESLFLESPERGNELKLFLDYVIESCEAESGLLSDWLSEYGSFPSGIKAKDICLLPRQKSDNQAYLYHLTKAKLAHCVITNHATLINFKKVGIGYKEFSTIIFDEAHKIESICSDFFNYHSSFKELQNVLTHVKDNYPKIKEMKEAVSLLENLKSQITINQKKHKLNYITVANSPVEFNDYYQVICQISNLLNKAAKKLDKQINQGEVDTEISVMLSKFDDAIWTFKNWKPDQKYPHIFSAVHFSPVIKKLSLATINLYSSRLMSWICHEISENSIFTSATISDNKPNLSFTTIANILGFKEEDVGQICSLSPVRYGDLSFVLSSEKIPAPIKSLDESQTEFQTGWITNVVGMIEVARQRGGAILCLTTSHHESKVIAQSLLNQNGVLLHQKNTSLNEYLPNFINENAQVLITSAGWEGLDVRKKDGSQLVKHVVISRIPFRPPNELLEYFYNEYVKRQAKDTKYQPQGISWLNQINAVVPKLKQGFGRLLRDYNDEGTIWIADPRMPHSSKARNNTMLLYAVPKRFKQTYSKAEVFGEAKKQVFII